MQCGRTKNRQYKFVCCCTKHVKHGNNFLRYWIRSVELPFCLSASDNYYQTHSPTDFIWYDSRRIFAVILLKPEISYSTREAPWETYSQFETVVLENGRCRLHSRFRWEDACTHYHYVPFIFTVKGLLWLKGTVYAHLTPCTLCHSVICCILTGAQYVDGRANVSEHSESIAVHTHTRLDSGVFGTVIHQTVWKCDFADPYGYTPYWLQRITCHVIQA